MVSGSEMDQKSTKSRSKTRPEAKFSEFGAARASKSDPRASKSGPRADKERPRTRQEGNLSRLEQKKVTKSGKNSPGGRGSAATRRPVEG